MFNFQFPFFQTEHINEVIKNGFMTSEEYILEQIKEFESSIKRRNMVKGYEYFTGRHDVLLKKRTAIGIGGEPTEIHNVPNNRIVDNQYRKLVIQKVNYLLGKPITLNSNNSKLNKALKEIFNADFDMTLKAICEDSLNCGLGWLFTGYDSNGNFTFKRISPWELVPIWEDSQHKILSYAIRFYDVVNYENKKRITRRKIEIYDKKGISRFYIDRGKMVHDGKKWFTPYFCNSKQGYGWERIPLIAFKYNHCEEPLILRVKCLQDGLNILESNFLNSMEEDPRNTILVLKNYDGENLGEFRQNLSTYGAVKVRTIDGAMGGVETLSIQVNAENYKAIIDIFKKAVIENGMGYDAKDDKLSGNPNQLNIKSMYSDIDIDANNMEMEYQSSLMKVIWFVKQHLANTGRGNFGDIETKPIFNRDMLINESEAIDNCIKSLNIISKETAISKHPWVEDLEKELKRVEKAKEEKSGEQNLHKPQGDNIQS